MQSYRTPLPTKHLLGVCSVHRSSALSLLQISKKYTHYGAIILFMYFGLRMLYDVAFGGETVGPCIFSIPDLPNHCPGARLGHKANDETILKDQPPDSTGDTLRS